MFTPTGTNESIKDEPQSVRKSTEPPEVFAILTNINTELFNLSTQQAKDSLLIASIHSDIAQIATNYKLLNGTMRSVLARLPESTVMSDMKKVQTEVNRLGSSIATLNHKMVDCSSSTPQVVQPISIETHSDEPSILDIPSIRNTEDNVDHGTYAEATKARTPVIYKQTQSNCSTPTDYEVSKERRPPPSQQHSTTKKGTQNDVQSHNYDMEIHQIRQDTDHKFKAVRRRKTVSYFVGNIDRNTTENDIYDHFDQKKVHLTQVRIFYGKYGSSAKVNIPTDLEYLIDDDTFWPDGIVYRKWMTREEWERNRPTTSRPSRHQNRSYNQRRVSRYSRDQSCSRRNCWREDDSESEYKRANAWGSMPVDDWNDSERFFSTGGCNEAD